MLAKYSQCFSQLLFQLSHNEQIEYTSNIQIIIDKLKNDHISTQLLAIIANAQYETGNYEKSIEVYYKIFNLYSLDGDEMNTADALMNIGRNYYMLNRYMKAKDYYERALDIYKRNQYFTGIASALQKIAIILSHWGEYDKALNFNYEALNFWKEIDNILQIALVNYNIGIIYQELGDLSRARDCFQKGLNLFLELNNTREIVISTARIGDIYLQNGEYDKALEYYLKADMLGQQIKDKALEAETSFNLGKVYNLIGDYFKSIDHQRKSIRLNEEQDNIKALSENYAELGLVYLNFGHMDQALFYLEKGLEITLNINYKYQTNIYYKILSDVYFQLGSYKEAFDSYKRYIEGRDQISTEENKLKSAELLAKYQLSEKEKENERLRHSEQLKNAQIFNQYLVIVLVAVALLALLIISTIFRRRYKLNRKLNIQLSLKNKEIENQQIKVEHLNADLQGANAAKDRFFSIIAHDLKNPFNSLMGLIELLIEDYNAYDDNERQEFLIQMKSSSDQIYALLQNLLLWGSNQIGKTEVMKEKIDLNKIAIETISLIHSVAGKKILASTETFPRNVGLC
ncbi:MAG: tetratricopeptide repeat protein [Bacteroidales bacterium]